MIEFRYHYTRPILQADMDGSAEDCYSLYDREHSSFTCQAESREEADKLFDKYFEDEYHDEPWDYNEIDIKQVDEKILSEPEDPNQLRLFKKPREKPYVQPTLQYNPEAKQLEVVEPRARGKTKKNTKRGA